MILGRDIIQKIKVWYPHQLCKKFKINSSRSPLPKIL
nr:MAG TPA: hypothetical protein [Caudoviricetes sp.]